MKIKLLSLVLLTLSLSLSACGVKVFKSKAQSSVDQVDITRPPEIAASENKAFKVRPAKDEPISYEEWLKENTLPPKSEEK